MQIAGCLQSGLYARLYLRLEDGTRRITSNRANAHETLFARIRTHYISQCFLYGVPMEKPDVAPPKSLSGILELAKGFEPLTL